MTTTNLADITDPDIEAEAEETGPLRRCVATRMRLPKERMIRFVVGPDWNIVPDLTATLPGRGIWLSARDDVIETARTRGAFNRAARGQVVVAADLLSVLQAGLARRIGELLGLTRRAGQSVCGFQKAREWLLDGRAWLVVQAADGSAQECARFLSGVQGKLPAVAPLAGDALGAIFGRDHVVHVVVAPGRLATALRTECDRLAGLLGQTPSRFDDGDDDPNNNLLGDGAKAGDEAADGNGRIGA
ncbi:MAG: RNA-binding protein [Acetobacteraceae bacterium]|nr:RNA-binding protein [Acetobacteraceae bacterium]